MDFLLKYRAEKIAHGFLSAYIFTPFSNSYSGNFTKPISSDYIMEITQKICNLLQIEKKITPHSFRKTFIDMNFEYIVQENTKWLKKKFKHLSDDEIEIKAKKMTDKYIEANLEKIEKEDAENKRLFDKAVEKENLYLGLFGTD